MKRLLLLVGSTLATLALASQDPSDRPVSAPPGTPERPNILFLFADDQRVDTIGAWGNPGIRTPHLDDLVARGVSFQRNYCLGAAHGAVCMPSRAMLHSGRAYHRIDHHGLTGERLLGERLGEAGYRTFATGKWHNGRDSFARSFQEGRAVLFGGMSDHTKVPVVDMPERGTFGDVATAPKHSSEAFADAAVEFLGRAPGDDPWLCYVAFTAPHDPRDPPLPWRDRERPPLPANFLPQHPFDGGMMRVRDEKLAAWPRDPEVIRDQLAEYYGLIEHMDAQIGRILAALPEGRPTLIVYAADHGLALGSHGLLGKQSVYEHSLRAPMIVAGAGLPEGMRLTSMTYLHDLFPTVLGLAGLEPDVPVDGRDLRPLWEGRAAEVRDSVYLAMQRTQRSVCDGRWKLIVYPKVNHRQLFDLAADPDERIDLAPRPAHRHHIARLALLLDRWRRDLSDPDPLTSEEPAPLAIDLTGAEREPDRWQPEWIREKYFGDGADGKAGGESSGR